MVNRHIAQKRGMFVDLSTLSTFFCAQIQEKLSTSERMILSKLRVMHQVIHIIHMFVIFRAFLIFPYYGNKILYRCHKVTNFDKKTKISS